MFFRAKAVSTGIHVVTAAEIEYIETPPKRQPTEPQASMGPGRKPVEWEETLTYEILRPGPKLRAKLSASTDELKKYISRAVAKNPAYFAMRDDSVKSLLRQQRRLEGLIMQSLALVYEVYSTPAQRDAGFKVLVQALLDALVATGVPHVAAPSFLEEKIRHYHPVVASYAPYARSLALPAPPVIDRQALTEWAEHAMANVASTKSTAS